MERSNRWIESENAKAAAVLFDKRVFDMAKQAVASLQGSLVSYLCRVRLLHGWFGLNDLHSFEHYGRMTATV